MRLDLTVFNGKWHSGSTLYTYECPDVNVWIPEDGWVQIPFGQPEEDYGVSTYARRTYLDPKANVVIVELIAYRIDPPASQGDPPRGETYWWSEQDGDLHAGLLAAGWVTP